MRPVCPLIALAVISAARRETDYNNHISIHYLGGLSEPSLPLLLVYLTSRLVVFHACPMDVW